MKAINAVLNYIAPGQVETLKKELFNQNDHENEEKELLSCLSHAISEAPERRNIKIQLLSGVCKKETGGN